ncbi:hypothetical protein HY950_02875 [Candidatus Gottesmanbacteria bacterium]|nr:hypothetical protein [Candidatus Gottesmanbacteria bacterium]
MAIRFLVCSNPANLVAALEGKRTATVEAEYGDVVVEGSVLTLAHHGSRSANPAPCLADNGVGGEGIEAVGLSHIDLDALGGCAAILGRKPEADGFWALAAFVDVNGPHKIGRSGASAEDIRRLEAYWAWSESRKVFPPRDGSSLDVTDKVMEGIEAVERIVADDEALLTAGDDFVKKGDELNKLSFIEAKGGVIVRVCGGFSNHLYVTPNGEVGCAVVALRTDFHACTVSLADPISGVSCRDIVQSLWGSEAGGHPGIAGGPRNALMGLDELLKLRDATVAAVAGK